MHKNYQLSIGWDVNSEPFQSKGQDFPTQGCDRGWDTAGQGRFCRSAFVGRWTDWGREGFFPLHFPIEAGPRRTCRPTARSESAGETRGPAQGAKNDENRVIVDTMSSEKVLIPAPDEGWNSTCTLIFAVLLATFAKWLTSITLVRLSLCKVERFS